MIKSNIFISRIGIVQRSYSVTVANKSGILHEIVNNGSFAKCFETRNVVASSTNIQ